MLITASFPLFSTELTTGLTYDSHEDSFPIGTDFAIEEVFSDGSSLKTGLAYQNAGAYTASFTYCKFLNEFMLSGGINYDIKTTGISQNIAFGTGLIFKEFSLLASGSLRINPDNIFIPDAYSCTADLIFDTSEQIVDLSFLYVSQTSGTATSSRIGGGFVFTAYQEGAPADIDMITSVYYVDNSISNVRGLAVSAGMGINVYLPSMSIKLKGVADILDPEYTGSALPYSISIGTGFTF